MFYTYYLTFDLIFFSSVLDGEGIHWFALCHRELGHYEIFDSLGTEASYIKEVLKEFAGFCMFNETAVQAKTSKSCGEFCLFYIIQRYFNEDLSLEALLENCFSLDCAKNEEIVLTFLKEIENECVKL